MQNNSQDFTVERVHAATWLYGMGAHFVLLMRSPDKGIAKRPRTEWRDNRPTQADVIADIRAGMNVGIKPGSLQCMVVDIDTPKDAPLDDAVEIVKRAHRRLWDWHEPIASIHSSSERGMHVWYRTPARSSIGNAKWSVDGAGGADSGDIRANAGYVIMWDIVATANQLKRNFASATPIEFKEFSSRFLLKSGAKRTQGKTKAGGHTLGKDFGKDCEYLASQTAGDRNNLLNRIAFAWHKKGALKDEARRRRLAEAAAAAGLAADETEATLASATATDGMDAALAAAAVGHLGAAHCFAMKHGADYQFNHTRKIWMRCDNGIWQTDETAQAAADCIDIVKEMAANLDNPTAKSVSALYSAGFREGALRQASVLRALAVRETDFDTHAHMALLPDGNAINLDTMEILTDINDIRPLLLTDRSQLGVIPNRTMSCDITKSFLFDGLLGEYAVDDRDDIMDWLLAFIVSMVRGEGSCERFLFIQGLPGTGKSTFVGLLQHIGGRSQTTVSAKNVVNKYPTHPEWIAGLSGYRLAVINELPEYGDFTSSDLNVLVSSETVQCRFMYGNSFNLTPVLSLVVAGNTRPRIPETSGLLRRMTLIEANKQPAVVDLDLLDKMKAEAGGLLHWALEMHADTWRDRLHATPNCLAAGVQTYKTDGNPFSAWIADECVVDRGNTNLRSSQKELYSSYQAWCEEQGVNRPLAANHFSRQLNLLLGSQSGVRNRAMRDHIRTGIALNSTAQGRNWISLNNVREEDVPF